MVPTVEIRRRAVVMCGVFALAGAVAALYLWRYAAAGAGLDLLIGTVVAVLAVAHGVATVRAHTPVLVADERGLRIRLGRSWAGVPWDDVRRVTLLPRRGVRDGRVTVQVAREGGFVDGLGSGSRLAARWNRRMYDEPLSVGYGLTTTLNTPDLAGALRNLAHRRAEVVSSEPAETVSPPTVSLSPPSGSAAEAATASGPTGKRRPRPVVTALTGGSTTARRAEVTLPRSPLSAGALALADPTADPTADPSTPLPEDEELRHRPDDHPPAQDRDAEPAVDGTNGNVELVIDSTTALTARAMERLRGRFRPPTRAATGTADADGDVTVAEPESITPPDPAPSDPGIGSVLAAARENLGLSIDDLAERTRIRPHVLEALEADDFAPCGGDFYARGHLRMLGRVLGIDSDPLVQRYDESYATQPVTPREVFDARRETSGAGVLRQVTDGARWGLLIAVVLVLLLVWGIAKYVASQQGGEPAGSSGVLHSSVSVWTGSGTGSGTAGGTGR